MLSVGGLVSGLDTNSIISQLLEVERRPILQLQQKEVAFQVELSAYGSVQSALENLQSAVESLRTSNDFAQFSTSSQNTDLVTATANASAAVGSHQVTVQQLAQAHKLHSTGFADAEVVGAGTLHLQVGSGAVQDLTIDAAATITDVATAINDANAGVQASVIFDGTNHFLSLSADTTGAQNTINITVTDTDGNDTDAAGLSRLAVTPNGLTETQSALDAIIDVDGVLNIQRSSNTISDVLSGVTFTLHDAPTAPDNTTTVSVTHAIGDVRDTIRGFVEAFNDVVDTIGTQQFFDPETNAAGALLGDSTTNLIRRQLNNLVSNTVPGLDASLSRLADLGITRDTEGKLTIDSSTLSHALETRFDETVQLFTQTDEGAEGFAVRMGDGLERILASNTGILSVRQKGIQTSIDSLNEKAVRLNDRLVSTEERLRAQFTSLELLLSQFQATSDALNQQLTGLQNLNRSIANK